MDGMDGSRALGCEFKRMSSIIGRCIRNEMTNRGFDEVAVMHGWVLGYLYGHRSETIYQKDLEERFGLAKSSVASIVKLMEQKAYIRRETDSEDARYKRVILTDKGVEVQLQTMRLIDDINARLEEGITEEEKKCFRTMIEKMLINIRPSDEQETDF